MHQNKELGASHESIRSRDASPLPRGKADPLSRSGHRRAVIRTLPPIPGKREVAIGDDPGPWIPVPAASGCQRYPHMFCLGQTGPRPGRINPVAVAATTGPDQIDESVGASAGARASDPGSPVPTGWRQMGSRDPPAADAAWPGRCGTPPRPAGSTREEAPKPLSLRRDSPLAVGLTAMAVPLLVDCGVQAGQKTVLSRYI